MIIMEVVAQGEDAFRVLLHSSTSAAVNCFIAMAVTDCVNYIPDF
jgi:hypothetical protein